MIKMKIVLTCVVFVLFLSCSKVEILTEGEKIGQEIAALAKSENVSLATTYILAYYNAEAYLTTDVYQAPFEISGQIIKVGSTYYNLSRLTKYKIGTEDDINCIFLTFDVY